MTNNNILTSDVFCICVCHSNTQIIPVAAVRLGSESRNLKQGDVTWQSSL